ncbi:tight adherence protein D [Mesocricetibacter intestinalis]|uniref:Tight adherence protein D n=1 Tax=Mesocricetibacter intestinalis TaxID=1521930 RepID=A0A4R6V864_9PAST|nr:tetratricopeptide repeat protein [Mesocricetibacter intestinalis]TDQ57632.1 tight adherence protein D [Mesocricetibacter intestinalis]
MFSKSVKKVLFLGFIISLSACSGLGKAPTQDSFSAKEKLYESTRNYGGLVSLYRDALKANDEPLTRYKLASSYYKKGDNKSSLLYLSPLLTAQNPLEEKAGVLQVRNLIQLQEYDKAISAANGLIGKYPKNGEIYNLRGISFAQVGRLANAKDDIIKARELFIDDVTAINNLAMLSIINGDYRNATEILLPQYLNGVKDPRLIHNLVFALVKNNDTDYALDIIRKERLNTSPEDLIASLKQAERILPIGE